MKALNKNHINSAFDEIMARFCIDYRIRGDQMTLYIHFLKQGGFQVVICRNNRPVSEIPIWNLITHKMIGLRFGQAAISKLFNAVHIAFSNELKAENQKIDLVLYHSSKVHCPCMGILTNNKTYKVMKLADIIEAIGLESEQLN